MPELTPSDRIGNVRTALFFAQQKVYFFVVQEIGTTGYDALKGILPAFMASLAFVSLTTAVGAGAGAAAGALGIGLGTVPLGIAGGAFGFKTGLWILNLLGVAFLIEHMGSGLQEAARHIEYGFTRAWGPISPTDRFSSRDGNVVRAGDEFALGVAVLIRCLLEGVVLYLTAKGISKLPEMVAHIRNSKLGNGFAVWVEQNYQQLLNNPRLAARGGGGISPVKAAREPFAGEAPEYKQPGAKTPEEKALAVSYHYTASKWAQAIEKEGLRPGTYATPVGDLAPLQAQIELALPPNRGLPEIKIRIDLDGLRNAGFAIPEVTRVSSTVTGPGGRVYQMPGGGYEMKFPYSVPAEFIRVMQIK